MGSDRLAWDETIGDSWTLLADFRGNRIDRFHLQLLTPVGDRVEFSQDGVTVHMIARAEDDSVTFDNRPIRGRLWAKSDNAEGSAVAVNIW